MEARWSMRFGVCLMEWLESVEHSFESGNGIWISKISQLLGRSNSIGKGTVFLLIDALFKSLWVLAFSLWPVQNICILRRMILWGRNASWFWRGVPKEWIERQKNWGAELIFGRGIYIRLLKITIYVNNGVMYHFHKEKLIDVN